MLLLIGRFNETEKDICQVKIHQVTKMNLSTQLMCKDSTQVLFNSVLLNTFAQWNTMEMADIHSSDRWLIMFPLLVLNPESGH